MATHMTIRWRLFILAALIGWGLWWAATTQAAAAETWVMTGVDRFNLAQALQRSQGIVMDSVTNDLLFSWQFGLQRTSPAPAYTVLANAPNAIPSVLRQQGSDHIGCLDYHAGLIYAPIEDGDEVAPPVIALFDAQTLAFTGDYFPLPRDLQAEGVPWVAVDPTRGLAYAAPWNPTPALNVYDLTTFSFIRSLPLSIPLGRIQGAKVYEGALYAAADDTYHTVYRIDLDNGEVVDLFHLLDLPGVDPDDPWLETEGLAFYPTDDGAVMHVILIQGIHTNTNRPISYMPITNLYHFKLVE